jgi:Ser/Thr protein kinase RdoA (MazF antagonist)
MTIRWIGALQPDPAIKGVIRLAQASGPRKFLRDLAAQVELDGWIENAIFEVLKQRRGERALIRIVSSDGPRFHVKLTRSGGGESRAAEMNWRADAAEAAGAILPRAIAYLPRFRAIVMPSIDGLPILTRTSVAFAAAGRVLSRIHAALPRPRLERGRAFEFNGFASPAGDERNRPAPEMDPALRSEIDRWKTIEPRRAADGGGVTLHGDLYPEQVLFCGSGKIAILDWDNSCAGEAERDVGNFIAHLILEEERGTVADATKLVEAFCGGYASACGERRLRPEVLAWYTTGSLLRLAALHRDPGFGSRPPNAPSLAGRLLDRARESATAIEPA